MSEAFDNVRVMMLAGGLALELSLSFLGWGTAGGLLRLVLLPLATAFIAFGGHLRCKLCEIL